MWCTLSVNNLSSHGANFAHPIVFLFTCDWADQFDMLKSIQNDLFILIVFIVFDHFGDLSQVFGKFTECFVLNLT